MVVFSWVVTVFFSIFYEDDIIVSMIQFKNHVFFLSKFNENFHLSTPLIYVFKQVIDIPFYS